jgi:hypothetical protein
VLDAVTLEKAGMPTVVVAVEKLANTTGTGMARAQGYTDLPIVPVDYAFGSLESCFQPEEHERLAAQALPGVEKGLTGK